MTVPADAELATVGWSGYSATSNFFSGGGMTLTKGAADTAMVNIPGGDALNKWCCTMFYMVSPDTGSNKTLKWDWAGTGSAGDGASMCSVTFWKGINTASPVRNSAGTQADGLPYTTGTITAVSGDLIIAFAGSSVVSVEGTFSTWSNLTTLSNLAAQSGGADGAWATGSPSGNTTVAASTGTNLNDGGIVAASFKAATATFMAKNGLLIPQAVKRAATY
jgi:hypothetical protein